MDVKRWKVEIDSDTCPHLNKWEKNCCHPNNFMVPCYKTDCPLLPRPDPAEVERLLNEIIKLSKLCEKALWSRTIEKSVEYELELDKARSELLKLVEGE